MSQSGVVILDDARKTSDYYYRRLTAPSSAVVGALKVVGHYAALFAGALVGTWH
jgi:hypothetical protein